MPEIESASNITYYRIVKGRTVTKVDADHPQAVRRDWEDSSGNKGTTYERQIKGFKGKIVDIFIKDSDYGKTLETVFDDGSDQLAQFSVKFDSRLGATILTRLKNINFNHEVAYSSFWDKDNERSMMAVFQDGEAVKPYFTKDGPNQTPEWEYNKVKNTWDNTKYLEFMQKMLINDIQPALGVSELFRSGTSYRKETTEHKEPMPDHELYEGMENYPAEWDSEEFKKNM